MAGRIGRKLAALALVTLVAVPLLSMALSPPWAGQPLTDALGLPRPTVVAHRGCAYAPEETVPAYDIARLQGADYLEMDVQRSADGVLIALHDDTLERTTNVSAVYSTRAQDTVDHFTWEEIARLDTGASYNARAPEYARPAYIGTPVARLSDVLAVAALGGNGLGGSGPGVYIETKAASRFPGIEAQLVAELRNAGWLAEQAGPPRVIFQSFEADSLARLAELAPSVPRVLLVSASMAESQGWGKLVDQATALDAGMGPVGTLGWPWYAGRAHRAGRLLHFYTINKLWQAQLLSAFGADGFFTDRPDLLLKFAGRTPAESLDAIPSAPL